MYDASAEEEEGATPNFQLVTEQSELSRGLGSCGAGRRRHVYFGHGFAVAARAMLVSCTLTTCKVIPGC